MSSRKLILSFIAVSVLLSLCSVVVVEASSTGWSRTYGGTYRDEARSLVETSDGGYAIAGHTRSFGAGVDDFWLVKTDGSGSMEWNRTYGGTLFDYAYSLVATSDGGYALAGSTFSFGAGSFDFWLVKTDEFGYVEWNRTYGGTGDDYAYSLVATSDGGYALAGYTDSFGTGNYDFWLIKTDALGNIEWNQTYGETGLTSPFTCSLVAASDGGYAIFGTILSFSAKSTDYRLIKTDEYGNMEWNKTYGDGNVYEPYSLVETSDGGYAIAGSISPLGEEDDFWLVKIDSFGNVEWDRLYGGTATDRAHSLVATSDGGYAIAGSWDCEEWYNLDTGEEVSHGTFWLIKTDALGNMEWNQTYGEPEHIWARSLVATSDGGYAIAGSRRSFSTGGYDFWLVKTDEYGIVPEYSSWLLPSLLLTATLVIVIYKKKFFDDQP